MLNVTAAVKNLSSKKTEKIVIFVANSIAKTVDLKLKYFLKQKMGSLEIFVLYATVNFTYMKFYKRKTL